VRVGDTLSLGCYVSNVDHVYGVAFRVYYDGTVLKSVNTGELETGTVFASFPTQPTFQPLEGENGFVVGLTIDEPLAVEDAPSVSAEQLLLRVRGFLEAIKAGETQLTFEAYALKTPALQDITATWQFPEAFTVQAGGVVRLVVE